MDICLLAPFLCSFPQQLVFPNVIINIYFAFFNIETLCVCVWVWRGERGFINALTVDQTLRKFAFNSTVLWRIYETFLISETHFACMPRQTGFVSFAVCVYVHGCCFPNTVARRGSFQSLLMFSLVSKFRYIMRFLLDLFKSLRGKGFSTE